MILMMSKVKQHLKFSIMRIDCDQKMQRKVQSHPKLVLLFHHGMFCRNWNYSEMKPEEKNYKKKNNKSENFISPP